MPSWDGVRWTQGRETLLEEDAQFIFSEHSGRGVLRSYAASLVPPPPMEVLDRAGRWNLEAGEGYNQLNMFSTRQLQATMASAFRSAVSGLEPNIIEADDSVFPLASKRWELKDFNKIVSQSTRFRDFQDKSLN